MSRTLRRIVFASAAFVLGTAVYNRYLATWPYRSILRAVQLVLCVVNLLDLVWVSRWNLALGVPDKWFAMGYEVLQPLAKRSNLIPIFILAAKLCPPRAQATAFALNMGLANFGYAAGSKCALGEAMAVHQQLLRLRSKAWGCPPHS